MRTSISGSILRLLHTSMLRKIIICFCVVGISHSLRAQSVDTLWYEGWEGNWLPDWHVDGGSWEVGVPTSGPNRAHTGEKCAGTVLGGNYSEPVDAYLVRHTPFAVPSSSQHPRIRFWGWHDFGYHNSWGYACDTGFVLVRVGSGSWQKTAGQVTDRGGGVWSCALVDLSPYAGLSIQVAFRFKSVAVYGMTPGSGWYIDDVAFLTGPVTFNDTQDFEAGFGNWGSNFGSWEVGSPTYGPDTAHTLPNCAGTVLDTNYTEASESRLISPSFEVPSAGGNPRLRFWHWYEFAWFDSGFVQIRVSSGQWQTLGCFSGSGSGVWSTPSYDLASYADSIVEVSFYFKSRHLNTNGPPNVGPGWYVDDISIERLAPPPAPSLSSPANGSTNVSINPWLRWQPTTQTISYHLQVDTSSTFGHPTVDRDSIAIPSDSVITPLRNLTKYYWRVRATNTAGTSDWSQVWEFTTTVQLPAQVVLSSPGDGDTVRVDSVLTVWQASQPAVNGYWHERATNPSFTNSIIDETLTGTTKLLRGLGNHLTYWWKVKARNAAGYGPFSNVWRFTVEIPTGVIKVDEIPKSLSLSQNYPNPFNPSTTIKYGLPRRGYVTLAVYNSLGQQVAVLADETQDAGYHEVVFQNPGLASGAYLCRLQTGGFTSTKKLLLLK